MAEAASAHFTHRASEVHLARLALEYGVHRFRYIETGLVDPLGPEDLFSLNADILQAGLQAIPESWRFLRQAAGEMLVDEGWLDLPAARGTQGRENAIAANRARAMARARELSQRKPSQGIDLIEPESD